MWCDNEDRNPKEAPYMLRQPLGELPVSIRRYETTVTGKTTQRRVPLTIFYPSIRWETEYPYQDPVWQKSPDHPDNGVHTFCGKEEALAEVKNKYPVILFSHGLCGYEMESTVLCADLASYRYVVVSIGHPRGSKVVTYIDGSIYEDPEPFSKIRHKLDTVEPLWYEDFLSARDMLSNLNQTDPFWRDHLDVSDIGIVGNSFGGCCGNATALKNNTFRYAINLDGGLFVPLTYSFTDTPILILRSILNFKSNAGLSRHGCTNVEVTKYRKLVHYEFSDGIYLGPRGKKNRDWADQISRERSERILAFLTKSRSDL